MRSAWCNSCMITLCSALSVAAIHKSLDLASGVFPLSSQTSARSLVPSHERGVSFCCWILQSNPEPREILGCFFLPKGPVQFSFPGKFVSPFHCVSFSLQSSARSNASLAHWLADLFPVKWILRPHSKPRETSRWFFLPRDLFNFLFLANLFLLFLAI